MVFSISFELNPTAIDNVREVINCVIFRSCPRIVGLPVRMVCYLCVMNGIMSKFNFSHVFSL